MDNITELNNLNHANVLKKGKHTRTIWNKAPEKKTTVTRKTDNKSERNKPKNIDQGMETTKCRMSNSNKIGDCKIMKEKSTNKPIMKASNGTYSKRTNPSRGKNSKRHLPGSLGIPFSIYCHNDVTKLYTKKKAEGTNLQTCRKI